VTPAQQVTRMIDGPLTFSPGSILELVSGVASAASTYILVTASGKIFDSPIIVNHDGITGVATVELFSCLQQSHDDQRHRFLRAGAFSRVRRVEEAFPLHHPCLRHRFRSFTGRFRFPPRFTQVSLSLALPGFWTFWCMSRLCFELPVLCFFRLWFMVLWG